MGPLTINYWGDVAGEVAGHVANWVTWRVTWHGQVKLDVKPVKVDGNARSEPFLKTCVLHLSHRILVYIG